jgi:hypothetical protein
MPTDYGIDDLESLSDADMADLETADEWEGTW